jgi:hypothetical protein
MVDFKKNITFILLIFISAFSFSQEGTRNNSNSDVTIKGKIMIIPFEPKLYMSEIDQKINQSTKWNFETIRENFRHQLDAQLKLKLQSIVPVVSFYSDSTKMSKDLEYTYKSTSVSYDPIEKPTSATTPTKKQSGIKNGQVEVEINEEKKFMNTKIANTEALPYLGKKYNSDYFVFVNELDIKNDANTYDIASDTYQREVVVHYSILDKTSKTITAGIAAFRFSSKISDPKKIVSLCFSPIAADIAAKFSAALNPKSATTPKK